MGITYEQIRKANETIKTTDIKGKDYAEVNQRIKAFRMVYPEGFITDEMLSNENGVAYFKASVGYYAENGVPRVLGTGYAFEKESSSYINKTSYIENGDTSAIGRALGMAGFGIDTSVASYEEVSNAIANQGEPEKPKGRKQAQAPAPAPTPADDLPEIPDNPPETKKAPTATAYQIDVLSKTYTGENLTKLLEMNNITKLADIPMSKASELIEKINKRKNKNNG